MQYIFYNIDLIKKKIILFIAFFLIFQSLVFSKEEIINGNIDNGIKLFKKECTACHSIDLNKKLIGPPLNKITEKRNKEWLYKWIKNNKKLRKSGDKDAISIYKEYNNLEMNSFEHLSEKDINDILSFLDNPQINSSPINKTNDKNNNKEKINTYNNEIIIKIITIGFLFLTFILLTILFKLHSLVNAIKSKNLIEYQKNKSLFKISINISIYKTLKKHSFVGYIFIFLFFIISIYSIWEYLINIDVNKGYKPIQPIYFSHKIHSGINGIDCQYCHSEAKYGKISGIPSANVCMNCHNTIDEYKGDYKENGKDKNFYTKEIQKLYKSIGWDPKNRKYSGKINPIKWIKIHNMPDFVYFDHSQHVIVGEKSIKKNKNVNIVCNACHGDVKKMDVVEMVNDFTMEWCINCHRTIEVDSKNKYYLEHFNNVHKYKSILEKNNKKLKLNNIGGLECGKCHY